MPPEVRVEHAQRTWSVEARKQVLPTFSRPVRDSRAAASVTLLPQTCLWSGQCASWHSLVQYAGRNWSSAPAFRQPPHLGSAPPPGAGGEKHQAQRVGSAVSSGFAGRPLALDDAGSAGSCSSADESSSISSADFQRELNFAQSLVNSYQIGPDQARFGFAFFSTAGNLDLGLTSTKTIIDWIILKS